MDVSKNRGIPKWMVSNGKPLLKWMIWGETPLFLETPMSGTRDLSSLPICRWRNMIPVPWPALMTKGPETNTPQATPRGQL